MKQLYEAETTKVRLLRKLMLDLACHESCVLPKSISLTYSSDFTWMALVNCSTHIWSLVTPQFIYTGYQYLILNLLKFLVAPSLKLVFLSILFPTTLNPWSSKFRGTKGLFIQ